MDELGPRGKLARDLILAYPLAGSGPRIDGSRTGANMFRHDPACEACNNEAATAFALIENDSGEPQWKFCGACTADSDQEKYYMQFEGFFHSPAATVDWLAHMHEKGCMNWDDFMDMITRLRTATHSYGSLSQ